MPEPEKLRLLYWDTYQSWVDKLPEKYQQIALFNGHPRGVPKTVCNYPGAGQFPGDFSVRILGMGVQVNASEDHIEDIVKANSVCSLWIGDSTSKELSLRLSKAFLGEEERFAEEQDIPDGFLGELVEKAQLVVPPRQPMCVHLGFDGAAEALLRRIETRVGPGAGWVEIVVYLLCERTRAVQ
jgi:hypothetical protein